MTNRKACSQFLLAVATAMATLGASPPNARSTPAAHNRGVALNDDRAAHMAEGVGRYADAERLYIAAEVADSSFADAFFDLAHMYIRRGNLIGADIQLHALLSVAPQTLGANDFLGGVQELEGQSAAAMESYAAELRIHADTTASGALSRLKARGVSSTRAQGGVPVASPPPNPHVVALATAHPLPASSTWPSPSSTPSLSPPQPSSPSPHSLPTPRASSSSRISPSPRGTHAVPPLPPSPQRTRPLGNAQASPPSSRATSSPGTHDDVQANARAPQQTLAPDDVAPSHPPSRAIPLPSLPPPLPPPTPGASPTPLPSASPSIMASATVGSARQYLLDVARDFDFTHALPHAAAPDDPMRLSLDAERALARRGGGRSADEFEALGTQALFVGRLDLAGRLFAAATAANPADWRAPYLQGLVAQNAGDFAHARTDYQISRSRAMRPEAETSLAIVDLASGNLDAAYDEAMQAVSLDALYEPARFTAGMLALARGSNLQAELQLSTAIRLGNAPDMTSLFLAIAKGSPPVPH